LSPKNPRTYWSFAQNQYYQGKSDYAFQSTQQAIAIEPRILSSYNIAINLAAAMNNEQGIKDVALKGYQASLNEIEKNPDEFSNYTSAIFFASKAKDQAKIDEAIKKALIHNPNWENDLKKAISGQ
jgi:tetratricopeptide (TPR) repeat protein